MEHIKSSTKLCPLCQKEFTPKSPKQTYCLNIHYFKCKICGIDVEIKRDRFNDPHNTCGSTSCVSQYRSQQNLIRYGCKDPGNSPEAIAKRKQTCLEKYGVDNPAKCSDFKSKATSTFQMNYNVAWGSQSHQVKDKIKSTVEARYGVNREAIVAKAVDTNLNKYGVANPMQLPENVEKCKNTRYQNYGQYQSQYQVDKLYQVNHDPDRIAARNAKSTATYQAKYGVNHYTQTLEGRSRLHDIQLAAIAADSSLLERRRQTCLDRYGVPYPPQLFSSESIEKARQSIIQNKKSRISKPNQILHDLLIDNNINCEYEFPIGRRWYDLVLPEHRIVIEVNPTYTHSLEPTEVYGDGLDNNYHLNKTKLAQQYNYRCIHIFDWDNVYKIVAMLNNNKTKVFARTCLIKPIDSATANEFCELHHLQGKCNNIKYAVGLFNNDKLIQVMTFGRPRYSNKYEWELLRLCTASDIKVVGGASKLFKHFIRDNHPQSIISYCDVAKFNGDVYYQLGMELHHTSAPAKIWSKGSKYITDNLLRQRGYDQLFNTCYGKGTSNEELMIQNGWRSVYDCGQKVFVRQFTEADWG